MTVFSFCQFCNTQTACVIRSEFVGLVYTNIHNSQIKNTILCSDCGNEKACTLHFTILENPEVLFNDGKTTNEK